MAAAALGVFEQLGQGDKTADEIAAACQTNPVATQHLLNCLVGIGYARWSHGKYGMNALTANGCCVPVPTPSCKLALQLFEWDLMEKLEDYVRTGKPIDLHSSMSPEQWSMYGYECAMSRQVLRSNWPSGCLSEREQPACWI